MTTVVPPSLAVMYIRSTGEQVPATIIGRSTRRDDFIHLKYMRNGHEVEHHAPLDCVLFSIGSPSPSPSEKQRNRKPKPIPKPEAKPAPKPAPKGKHMQLFKMRRNVGKSFYSTAPDAPDGQ